jgi:hypothetical protein
VETLCTYVWKQKNEICQNYSMNGEWGDKGDDEGGEFNYDIL